MNTVVVQPYYCYLHRGNSLGNPYFGVRWTGFFWSFNHEHVFWDNTQSFFVYGRSMPSNSVRIAAKKPNILKKFTSFVNFFSQQKVFTSTLLISSKASEHLWWSDYLGSLIVLQNSLIVEPSYLFFLFVLVEQICSKLLVQYWSQPNSVFEDKIVVCLHLEKLARCYLMGLNFVLFFFELTGCWLLKYFMINIVLLINWWKRMYCMQCEFFPSSNIGEINSFSVVSFGFVSTGCECISVSLFW